MPLLIRSILKTSPDSGTVVADPTGRHRRVGNLKRHLFKIFFQIFRLPFSSWLQIRTQILKRMKDEEQIQLLKFQKPKLSTLLKQLRNKHLKNNQKTNECKAKKTDSLPSSRFDLALNFVVWIDSNSQWLVRVVVVIPIESNLLLVVVYLTDPYHFCSSFSVSFSASMLYGDEFWRCGC